MYKQDNYNVLAYPPGFRMTYRYPEEYVPDIIKSKFEQSESKNLFKNKDAVIVAVTMNNFQFYPLRRVEIQKFDRMGRFYRICFELTADLVEYPPPDSEESDIFPSDVISFIKSISAYHFPSAGESTPSEVIWSLSTRPKAPSWFDEVIPGDFLSTCDRDAINFASTTGDTDIERWENLDEPWDRIIAALAEQKDYKHQLFYRLLYVSKAGSDSKLPVKQSKSRIERSVGLVKDIIPLLSSRPLYWESGCYVLSSRLDYKFKFEFRFGEFPPENSEESSFKVDTDNIRHVVGDDFNLGFEAVQRSLYVSPPSQPKYSTASFTSSVSGENDIESPELEIPIVLKPDLPARAVFAVVIFLGITMAVGMLDPLIQYVPTIFPFVPTFQQNTISAGLKLLGIIVMTVSFDYYRVYF